MRKKPEAFVKAVSYNPVIDLNAVITGIKKMLHSKGVADSSIFIQQGFERRGSKAWDVFSIRCGLVTMHWRSDKPRNFTVKPDDPDLGSTRCFRIKKDDTVNVGAIVDLMLYPQSKARKGA